MEQNSQFSADQREILDVIEADLDSYMARDKDRWLENWVTNEEFHSIMECGTLQIANGFATFRDNIFEAMEIEPEEIKANVTRENIRIWVRGDLAWATFDQVIVETQNPRALASLSNNFRLLERRDGRWQIVFHGVWSQPLRDTASPTLEVTANCSVVWMNQAASMALESFRALRLSQGTLRAANLDWDRELRRQVARAHELTAFAKYNRAASAGGGSVTLPVVLGENDEGASLVCWVKVADGRVYVLFGNHPNLDQQIDIARIIHALSDAQAETIRMIAAGFDVAGIAEELGISINTVKTHLKRVFEKVEVSSQVELLRKLVSFSV
ncbi:LuxR C-terminal-related transcriptional regulator [Ahrensia marina]|uniref:LuxR C-terminal-related transcriptional regulator n=1 Tax=Ahrensia marina TaxID=1514904 RepID=UPI0035D0DDD2